MAEISSAMAYAGPMPSPTEEMAGFWEAAGRGVLALHRCGTCGAWHWPASACRTCRNAPFMSNMSWQPASGKATLFSFVIPRRTFHPAFPAPFVYGMVRCAEGPLMPAPVDVVPEAAKIGMALDVHFTKLSAEFTVPRFRPAGRT
jgi:uncharacterized OB-fold protein